jgi:hypothetical protein
MGSIQGVRRSNDFCIDNQDLMILILPPYDLRSKNRQRRIYHILGQRVRIIAQ